MGTEKHYWFRAKRYGLGWGLPCSWQGWAFFLAIHRGINHLERSRGRIFGEPRRESMIGIDQARLT
jgi:hypothetical protein